MAHGETGFICYWRIENFSFLKKTSECDLRSPTFYVKNFASNFYLKIPDFEEDYLGIDLIRVRSGFLEEHDLILNYSVSLLLKTGWVKIEENATHRFTKAYSYTGTDELVAREKLEKEPWTYLPNGCLTIKFNMWNSRTVSNASQYLIISRMLNRKDVCHMPLKIFKELKENDLEYFPSSYEFRQGREGKEILIDSKGEKYTLHNQENILKFLLEEKLCFVNLKTPQKEFMVHKAVLCATSPVFKAMFEQDMRENVVQIDDVDSETMTIFIKFLHMESIDELNWEQTVKLYYTAEKYQTEHLKQTCTSFLKKQLAVQNICEAFKLADMHQNDDLKQSALKYFILNFNAIHRSMEWKNFVLSTAEYAAEILHISANE